MNQQRRIAVIGAGASGILAALEAARMGCYVLLFDANPAVGRKLLVTGSGRCNITNQNVSAEKYACADQNFLRQLLGRFGHAELRRYLYDLGILIYATSDGWCYPYSDSAAAVVDAFSVALQQPNIELHLQARVTDLRWVKGAFKLAVDQVPDLYSVERVVLAAGGRAYPNLGARGDWVNPLARMGHTVLPLRPALAPLEADMKPYSRLQGVRLDAGVRLWDGKQLLGETLGNLIFTEWGLNGPGVMDLSHLVSARPGKALSLTLNLLADHETDFRAWLDEHRGSRLPLRVALEAALPPKLPPVLLDLAGLKGETALGAVPLPDLQRLLGIVSGLRFRVKGTRGFEHCQLSAGGVPVTEVNPLTLESLRVPGLHLAGEVLDVVGPCGGYNLQFAFSSGALAGRGAAAH